VVNSGPGLVFITYPEVVLKLPGGPIWAFIFFIMLVVGNLNLFLNINNIEIFYEEKLLIQKRQIRIKKVYFVVVEAGVFIHK
jgi:SNF family Na+-dependent transporter